MKKITRDLDLPEQWLLEPLPSDSRTATQIVRGDK